MGQLSGSKLNYVLGLQDLEVRQKGHANASSVWATRQGTKRILGLNPSLKISKGLCVRFITTANFLQCKHMRCQRTNRLRQVIKLCVVFLLCNNLLGVDAMSWGERGSRRSMSLP
jgi:hypothetical protein